MEELDQESDQKNRRLRRQQRRPRGGDVASTSAAEGERFECSGRSCAAAMIADCVALCCCPCAVVSFVAFALVKVPWAVGRRCFSAATKRRRKKKKRREGYDGEGERKGVVSAEAKWWTEEGIMGISSSTSTLSLSFEELEQERVWLELYQVGHLGFGRVSFTGTGIQLSTSAQPQLGNFPK